MADKENEGKVKQRWVDDYELCPWDELPSDGTE